MKQKTKELSILLTTSNVQEGQNLASRLRVQGHYIEVASGGFHTLNLLEDTNNSFNMMIIMGDQHDTSANEVTSHIRTLFSKKELPVLIMKDTQDKEEVLEAFSWGANDFSSRKLNFNDLLKRLEKLVKL